ncbi:2OG-Fe(II) oxygenase [Luteimonas sp. MC1750]|uniref:2OG-Fe(II) oxygenase n=1 Tax=Luteimonas sp. MC1750 TaxID=2799326 RepID=UPI0018F0B6F7|nr:2OG-Fe(II) oxygenase [Luteimonas sp. MC1750]MBJ6983572.1 2OG-Fe(II) oxygenase [Luteimonas sp. MC1750]QQO06417.1 2OG-Fe(II) oxygenase [Luteimonas sp. MC1750]
MSRTDALRDVVAPHVVADADSIRAGFIGARPFRHCVVEDFFAPAFVHDLLARFPGFDRGNALNEDGVAGGKSTVERIRGLGGAYAALDACIQTPAFLGLIERLTGIDGLLYDPDYFGGGTHDNRDGQALDTHIDFNHHPATGWHRRLNLIVYLNPEWDAAWGGALELRRDPHDPENDEVVAIAPAYNRCVIFETTEHSWHGFPPIRLPAGRESLSRRSVALYFYTRERPADEAAPAHSTVYVDRPLPSHLAAGHVLDASDMATLHELLARRDGHVRRLYGELHALQAQLDATPASRVLGAARRMLARLRR